MRASWILTSGCAPCIDDFILLGPSEAKTYAAYKSAQRVLTNLGMNVYDLTDTKAHREGKVDSGNIHDGTDFLGYRISATSRQPCEAACKKLLGKLETVVNRALR